MYFIVQHTLIQVTGKMLLVSIRFLLPAVKMNPWIHSKPNHQLVQLILARQAVVRCCAKFYKTGQKAINHMYTLVKMTMYCTYYLHVSKWIILFNRFKGLGTQGGCLKKIFGSPLFLLVNIVRDFFDLWFWKASTTPGHYRRKNNRVWSMDSLG